MKAMLVLNYKKMECIPEYFGIFGHNVAIILPENQNAT